MRILVLFSFAIMTASSAWGHGAIPAGPTSGIPVPLISHGEMAVIADYRARIWDLANNAIDTNEDFRRVLNFARIEYSLCMWGAVPFSVTDENSPFNECSHAYLAASKDVLMRMRVMTNEKAEATGIVSAIDIQLVQLQLSLIHCQFSAESFNTANLIRPRWASVPYHPASMAGLTSFAAILVFIAVGAGKLVKGGPNRA